jgi:RES domain-containing protein
MLLWRISRHLDLSGKGGLKAGGRWHLAGFPVVYTAESPAGALLESCVHTTAEDAPTTYTLLKIEGPDLITEEIASDSLPVGWTALLSVTQGMGTDWLKSRRSAMLRVPSALVPETMNCLLNPLHPDAAQFCIEQVYEYPFDLRLKR